MLPQFIKDSLCGCLEIFRGEVGELYQEIFELEDFLNEKFPEEELKIEEKEKGPSVMDIQPGEVFNI